MAVSAAVAARIDPERLPLVRERLDQELGDIGRRMKENEDEDLQTSEYTLRAVVAVALVLATIYGVTYTGFAPRGKGGGGRQGTEGGGFGSGASRAFVDAQAFALMDELFRVQLTGKCMPPLSDPVYNDIRLGSRATTNAGWDALKARIAATGPDFDDGCDFYGLGIAEARTDRKIGPADLCQGGVKAGLTAFQIVQGGVYDNTTEAALGWAYDNFFPLNLFLQVDASKGTRQDVINRAALFLLDFGDGGSSSDAREIAAEFCNTYFSDDDLAYYEERVQPWLGFPFPGAFTRMSNTLVTGASKSVLGTTGFLASTVVKTVYIVGDVVRQSPEAQLFIDATLGSVPRVEFTDEVVAGKIEVVVEDIADDLSNVVTARVPVVVLGRYAQSLPEYNALPRSQANILYLLTDYDPDGVLAAREAALMGPIGSVIANDASSSDVLNVLDVTMKFPFEAALGADYSRELDVAEIIMDVIQSRSIGITETFELYDTFALKNAVVLGEDIGGVLKRQAAIASLDAADYGRGFQQLPFSSQLVEEVQTDPAFGAAPAPPRLDYRTEKGGACVGPIVNQGRCNNCWAISATVSLGMRACAEGRSKTYVPLSVQHTTSCAEAKDGNGCNPNSPSAGFTFASTFGIVDSECFPFSQGTKSTTEVSCKKQCQSGTSRQHLFSSSTSYRRIVNAAAIKSELNANGPLAIGFGIPEDFEAFFANNPTGVYTNENTANIGDHLVVLVGYDDTAPIPHYILQNSWGEDFADNGYFRVKQNMLRRNHMTWFEDHAYVATVRKLDTESSDETVPAPSDRDDVPSQILNPDQAQNAPGTGDIDPLPAQPSAAAVTVASSASPALTWLLALFCTLVFFI